MLRECSETKGHTRSERAFCGGRSSVLRSEYECTRRVVESVPIECAKSEERQERGAIARMVMSAERAPSEHLW